MYFILILPEDGAALGNNPGAGRMSEVWKVLIQGMKEIIKTDIPNDAHKGLAELEEPGIL